MSSSPTAIAQVPRTVLTGLIVGWVIILTKCFLTPWAITHWQVPVHPAWVIVPTLIFASLVTLLVLTHDWKRDANEDERASDLPSGARLRTVPDSQDS